MKKFLTILFTLLISSAIYAQSAQVITDILESENVTYGQICYLSAVQQGLISENSSYAKAIETLYSHKQIPVIQYDEDPIPLANITYIYARMWNIKGGVFYRIFKGAPRYAYKQMKVDGILPANADPSLCISGVEALNIYTSCAVKYGKMNISVE